MPADARPPVPAPIGSLLEPAYRAVVRARNRAFDAGARVERVGVPVISIGNLSVGGTGKTPMVRWVVRVLGDMGLRPGVAMRGYGARRGGISDEQTEHAERMPGVPIVANPKRVAAARELIDRHGVDAIVLDDGFQHRFLARDLDIVLVDATRDPFADRCLPAGWLREPIESLERAGVIVMTRSDQVAPAALSGLTARLAARGHHARIVRARHEWIGFDTAGGIRPVGWLDGKAVIVACAIGNPCAFLEQARSHGAHIAGRMIRRDHHRWSAADAREVLALRNRAAGNAVPGAAVLLTTHKDWVKWRQTGDPWVLRAAARPIADIALDEPAAVRSAIVLAAGPGSDSLP